MSDRFDPTYRDLLEAASLAARAHQGQLRKDQKTPYVAHVFRVCLILRDLFGFDDPRMLMTAMLHDTIEDTTTDFDQLARRHGTEVAAWVAYLTKDNRLPHDEREAAYVAALKAAPWQVQACKLADVLDNTLDLAAFPRDRQLNHLKNSDRYYAALKDAPAPELARPLELVRQVIEDAHARLGR